MPTDAQDFNAATLKQLEAGLPRPQFQALLCDYLDDATRRLTRMATLVAGRRLSELALDAHEFVSCGTYGLERASNLARLLERTCNIGEIDDVRKRLAELTASATKGLDALRAAFLARQPRFPAAI
jgi:uncharacterized alpha-E superfamily protein